MAVLRGHDEVVLVQRATKSVMQELLIGNVATLIGHITQQERTGNHSELCAGGESA